MVTYLGCHQQKTIRKLPTGKVVTVLEDAMHQFFKAAVRKYEKLTAPLVAVKHSQGKLFPVRSASTPFVPDDQRESPAGSPGDGKVIKCTWCNNAFCFQPEHVYDSVAQFEASELARNKKKP